MGTEPNRETSVSVKRKSGEEMPLVDILIPTCGRKTALAIVLTSLLGQTFTDFSVTISDQTDEEHAYLDDCELQTLLSALRWHGHQVQVERHLPRRGMAEQRQFLLEQSRAPYVHYVDDDVLLDPPVLQRMLSVLQQEGCGFIGCAAPNFQFLSDVRPHQQQIELWTGPVVPESGPSSAAGLAAVRPRPRKRARSVSYWVPPTAAPSTATTWTPHTGCCSAERGRRRHRRASSAGTHSVSRNSLPKAGWATSALCCNRTTSA